MKDETATSFDGTTLRSSQATVITVYDLAGRLILTTGTPAHSLDVSHLPGGVYIATAGSSSIKFVR